MNGRHMRVPACLRRQIRRNLRLFADEGGSACPAMNQAWFRDYAARLVWEAEKLGVRVPRSLRHLRRSRVLLKQIAAVIKELGT